MLSNPATEQKIEQEPIGTCAEDIQEPHLVRQAQTSIGNPDRDQAVQRVLVIEFLLNLLVAAAKGIFGIATGSLSITADAIHSTVDASANVVGFFLLKQSTERPDPKHPYGHRKFEMVGSVALGLAIGAAGINLGISAVANLVTSQEAAPTELLGVAIIVGTLLVNIFVARYEARKARELKSSFLAADAAHTASDILVTLAVLISYGGSYMGITWADGVGALAVTIVISKVAWEVLASNLGVLVNQVQCDAAQIERVVLTVPGAQGCHRVRSHGTPDAIIVDLHAQADGNLSLAESHDLAHEIEEALYQDNPHIADITIHMEPAGDPIEDL